jgi:lysophospholipase L1-like esterase
MKKKDKIITRITKVFIFTFLVSISVKAQNSFVSVADTLIKSDSLNRYISPEFIAIDTSLRRLYPFIDFKKNNFQFYTANSPTFETLYSNMKKMIELKDRKLNFYHIGGSHIQADIYTNDVRNYLQTKWEGVPGERGMVFPFSLAKTNNPSNYSIKSTNNWQPYRCVGKDKCDLEFGCLGAVVSCPDSIINIVFKYNHTDVKPKFTHIRIMHNIGELPFEFNFGENEILILDKKTYESKGYTDVFFTDGIDSFDLQISRLIHEPAYFQLSGFQLANQKPGISYNSIGINGAGLYSYLACLNFKEQLKLLPPDFFAFSVGTNDGNVPYDAFDPKVYKNNLEKMMKIILEVNPDCAILLTVPNDSYYHRKYLNRNIAREREVIIELAKQYQIPVWDLYGLMGELGSSKKWLRAGLMRSDLVHFTGTGYHLKGELYIDALLKWMEQMEHFQPHKN